MVPLTDLPAAIRTTLAAWERLRWNELQFAQVPVAVLVLAALAALSLLVLLARGLGAQPRRRVRVALPAVLSSIRRSPLSPTRHAAFLLFVLGIPFFAVAIADPRSTFVHEDATASGRNIAIVIDGSGSMVLPFDAPKLEPALNRAFYAAVASAERLTRLRMAGKHADRIAVIQFGNEAYVVTPFTTDYENALLSLRLIGQPRAWNRFNIFGTTIIQGIEQGLQLFTTFDLPDRSGNMIVVFSDGNDGETTFRGRTLDDMMAEARERSIPIFMVRLGYGKRLGDVMWDRLWKSAVERSGGRFYVAADQDAILRAVSDIDRLSPGQIAVRRYASASPAFGGYAMVAVMLWLLAATLKLAFPWFRTFP